jgi:D-alanyl-D-alanine carboxypeptidase
MTTRALRTVLAAALAVLLTPALATAAPTRERPAAGGDVLNADVLRRALDGIPAAGAPGAFAEVRAGQRTWRGAAGLADLDGRPMRPGLRHRVGSVTKTFVATALLQLVGEGRLGLDDPVLRWLPRVPGLDRRVTVRMLLRHTSGIADYGQVIFATLEQIEENRPHAPLELARIGVALPPVGAPGEAHSYSNTNYILAGLVLQRVTGRDAAAEVTRRVIRPLGLRDTYFPGASPFIRGPHARGYVPWTEGLRDFSVYGHSWAWMAGDLISTTADLDRFFRALLGGRLLRPAQVAQLRDTVPMPPSDPADAGYGLGVFWVATPCGPVWGHDGITLGYQTLSLHSPDGRRQATVATNISHYQATPEEDHPIDVAVADFLLTALCGETGAGARSALPGARAAALARTVTPSARPVERAAVRSSGG